MLVSLAVLSGLSAGTVRIDPSKLHQTIRGFGASTAWEGRLSEDEANSLFSNGSDAQMGISILRVRIDPNRNWSDELSNATKARARGAAVLASPWTPPATMKSNGVTGGILPMKDAEGRVLKDEKGKEIHDSASEGVCSDWPGYAAHLADFLKYMEQGGGVVDVLSLQNEPDIDVTYEGCTWTGEQLRDFLKAHASTIKAAVSGERPPVKLMAAESFQFRKNATDPILADPESAALVDIVGTHVYGTRASELEKPYEAAFAQEKEVWMTEHYQEDTKDPLDFGLKTAEEIITCLTKAHMSAYLLWWMKDNSFSGEGGYRRGLMDMQGRLTPVGYAMGQFSKFVRPGFRRCTAFSEPVTGVSVAAFCDPASDRIVIVTVNRSDAAVPQDFEIDGGKRSGSASVWVTGPAHSLARQPDLPVSEGRFSYALPAGSIATIVVD